jgi:hypothetical protein
MCLVRCGRTHIARGLTERRARSIAAAAAVSCNLAIVCCAFTPGGKTQSVRGRKFCYILLFSLVMLFTRLVASTTLFRRDGEGGKCFHETFSLPRCPHRNDLLLRGETTHSNRKNIGEGCGVLAADGIFASGCGFFSALFSGKGVQCVGCNKAKRKLLLTLTSFFFFIHCK